VTTLAPLLLTLFLASPGSSAASQDSFATIDSSYQSIRLALLDDSTKDVQANAEAIAKAATALKANTTATAAGVAEADVGTVSDLLPQVIARAETLAAASEIGAQREALKTLTQPLVRWHEKLGGDRPRVAYCPMERGAWFQPDGVLGNPYGGTRMPRCGSFVTE